jgi:hypothetical protein
MFLNLMQPSLLNGILLITMLLWTFFDYNTCIEKILFSQITVYIFFTLVYQFSYFDFENWNHQFEVSETNFIS